MLCHYSTGSLFNTGNYTWKCHVQKRAVFNFFYLFDAFFRGNYFLNRTHVLTVLK